MKAIVRLVVLCFNCDCMIGQQKLLLCVAFILSSIHYVDSVLKHYETQLLKEKSAYSGLAESQRREVEDLLLEGDLLEVTTDETTQLWQVLQSDTECVNYFALSEEAASNYVVKAGLWRKVSVKKVVVLAASLLCTTFCLL